MKEKDKIVSPSADTEETKDLAVTSETLEEATEALKEDPAVDTEEKKEERELGVAEETYKEMSPLRLVLRRFFRSKLSIVGIVMIAALIIFSVLGPVIFNTWGEETVDRGDYVSEDVNYYQQDDGNGGYVSVTEVVESVDGINRLADPSPQHWLGTDEKGMDVFVRLMFGGRISLLIGFIVVILETLLGIIIGGAAGYFGGWVDNILMRIVDIFNCIPTLPILFIASAAINSWGLSEDVNIYLLMLFITLFSWSGTARLVRGQILGLREQEYITATEVMGFSPWRRIFKHLIPNVMPQLIVSMTLGLGSVILYESTLSYLGIGVQPPKAAWGSMIALANRPEILNYHVNVWLPAGLLIVIAVLGFNFIGDGLRDAMDPKARK